MSISIDTLSAQKLKVSHVAHSLNSNQRQEIGIQAIIGNTPILHVADRYKVSRKFVYQQKEKALSGIGKAFEIPSNKDEEVLFHLPVTKKWLEQSLLGLMFICKSSYQGVMEFFRDLFDYQISKGTVHNIVYKHLEKAKEINHQKDLSRVKEGLHDEIYQAGDPVLVGCCARSTYCYLLKLEESCDANAWGVHLLDLKEKQGLVPDFTIIDGGQAARKGQKDAWPEIPARGDTFHALKPFLEMVSYLENRAMGALKVVEGLNHQIMYPRGKWKNADNRVKLYQKLLEAEQISKKAFYLVDDLTILYRWLKNDILSLVGPTYANRQDLLKFLVEQLCLRESMCPHKIGPVRKYLENHADNLLEFVPHMEMCFYEIAQEFEVSLSDVIDVYQLKGLASSNRRRWEKHNELRARLGGNFYWIESLVDNVLDDTFRANSLVENINSRLRNYFTLRRELGGEYLEFLQFFLNHRRFMRSKYTERVGKSPAELLMGEKHKHWLEMLGFELFKQAA
ncbi:MAG: hypothetical protein H0T62_10000 [Parachlamydiaceae bacterium]|nr:hypothetical protein [Parachlamydiaceae bacterium]